MGIRSQGTGTGWDTQRDLLPVWRGDERTLLLCLSESGQDVTVGDGVASDTELWTPFLRNDLGQSVDAGLGETVVSLASVAVDA